MTVLRITKTAKITKITTIADGAEITKITTIAEIDFMRHLAIGLCTLPGVRVWRQNVGSVAFLDPRTQQKRVFHAGPPEGAADLSGILAPEGLRLEVEVKGARTRVTDAQRRWARFVAESGGVYAIVHYDRRRTPGDNVTLGVGVVADAIRDRRRTLRREAG